MKIIKFYYLIILEINEQMVTHTQLLLVLTAKSAALDKMLLM